MYFKDIETALLEQKEELEIKAGERVCFRPEEALIDLNSNLDQIVIGIRRSGKATLCFNVIKKSGLHFAYINFYDERFSKTMAEDLNKLLECLYKVHGDFNPSKGYKIHCFKCASQ